MESSILTTKQVIYHPPKPESFRRFARDVGTALAEQQGDVRYVDPAVIDGLAQFLMIVSDLLTIHLNRESEGIA